MYQNQSQAATTKSNIFTVSSLNAQVRLLLENEMGIVWLVGEISNFSAPVSGHWYLTLKDSRAQVKCAMFKGSNRRVTFAPKNGQQVLVKARLSLYEPRGDYQLVIESMQPEGDGKLQQEFEALKMKLAAEGLFAQSQKRPLPLHPKTIGVITSKTGAALHDILNVLKRRDPSLRVIIYPTQVQGEAAAFSIAQAIGRANMRNEVDVLIVGRGGGSLEDLWCFNHEVVARTIASSQIPIISAVGHEVDVTISDFVADMRAPTPSAAAELVSQDQSHKKVALQSQLTALTKAMSLVFSRLDTKLTHLKHRIDRQHPEHNLNRQAQKLDDFNARLKWAMEKKLNANQHKLERLNQSLAYQNPAQKLKQHQYKLDELKTRLEQGVKHQMLLKDHQFARMADKLDAVSPLSTLKRGYSMSYTQDKTLVQSVADVNIGEIIQTQVADGVIEARVVDISKTKQI